MQPLLLFFFTHQMSLRSITSNNSHQTLSTMGELDFDMSSQARYWMFDEESLQQCREAACQGAPKVRKFACGYANRNKGKKNDTTGNNTAATTHTFLSPQEQEQLVSFHAKEIQSLVGPDAIFPALRISSSTLSTAISLLRRFFLSNSAADYHPRNIACAAAMLAAKSESSHRLQVSYFTTWCDISTVAVVLYTHGAAGIAKIGNFVQRRTSADFLPF
jgi:cyclin H